MRWVFTPGNGKGLIRKSVAVEAGEGSHNRKSSSSTKPLTSGLFRVPQNSNLTLNVYVVNNLDNTTVDVSIQVNRLTTTSGVSRKEEIVSRQLSLGPMEATVISTDITSGGVYEVNATTPSPGTQPTTPPVTVSADVVQFFPADGATTPIISRSAGSFATPVAPGDSWSLGTTAPHGLITTGLLDFAQGVAASRPQAEVLISSFADIPLRAEVIVRELVEHNPVPQPIEERTVRIPPGGAVVVPLESVEGRTGQILVKAPAGLVISLEAYILFLADETTQPIFSLSPRDWIQLR